MRYHFFPNHFEKKVKIEERKSPLSDRTLATDADCTSYHTEAFVKTEVGCNVLHRFSTFVVQGALSDRY